MSKLEFSVDDAMRVFEGSGDELADLRVRLLFNGYTPLPANGKGSLPKGWSNLDEEGNQRGIQPTIKIIDQWSTQYPNWHSTSVRCGEVVAIDCDILDNAVADRVREEARRCFGTAFPTRVGRPPKFILLARTKVPFKWLATGKYVQPDGGESRVEVLSRGRQFIALGIHSGTGKPYEWFGGDPENTPVADLPEVSREQVVEFLGAAEAILSAQQGWVLHPKARGNYEEQEREEPAQDYSGKPTDWVKLERALDALTEVGDRDTYIRIIAALKDGTDDRKRAYALAFRWAAQYPHYFDAIGLQKTWDSFKKGHGVTLGTIYHLAREAEPRNRDASGFGVHDSEEGGRATATKHTVEDFVAYRPGGSFIFIPTRDMWPANSVNASVWPVGADKPVPAAQWIAAHRAVEQMTWAPGEPMEIRNKLVSEGGWIERSGCTVFNLYRPPVITPKSGPVDLWLDHVRQLFGDDAEHIIRWLAHRVQRPQEKINHAIVLGGAQGIGKDSLLEPIKHAVGPWNFQEVSPRQMMGRFNTFVRSVILRVSEVRDLGDVDRYAFYDHMKTYTAAPPDVLRVDQKHVNEYSVLNICGVIITSNHKTDGIYLPADDRRHFVAWTDKTKGDFTMAYWDKLHGWYANDGHASVAGYLQKLDLSGFEPKAPPPKTAAFHEIVGASRAPEDAEMADVLDGLGEPAAVTLDVITTKASTMGRYEFSQWLRDRKNARKVPHRLEECGYVRVENPDAKDGVFKVSSRRVAIYARRDLPLQERITAAKRLAKGDYEVPGSRGS
jgi:hypothetical protein